MSMLACLPPQAAREALTDPVFQKGPDYKNKFGFVFGDGLVTSTGEKHKGKAGLAGLLWGVRVKILDLTPWHWCTYALS